MSGADYRIAWRPKASEDLRSIVRYIAQDSPRVREPSARSCARRSSRWPSIRCSAMKAGQGCRPTCANSCCIPNYIAFYRVIEASRTVEILRVKHVAQQTP
jgi:toxin ParE1/3/4